MYIGRMASLMLLVVSGLLIAPSLSRACGKAQENAQGWDMTARHYGNGGLIYVNTAGTLSGLHVDGVARSFFVVGSDGDDVEVGWDDGNGTSNPTVYAEWVNDGVDSGVLHYTGYSLSYDTNYTFKVQNVGQIYIWRFYVDGQSSPFNYSPTMSFQQGYVIGNSERHNNCDSMWTHQYRLQYYSSAGDWNDWSSDSEKTCTATDGWEFNDVSDTEFYVDQNAGVC